MADSNGSSSPDPIALPSSPLVPPESRLGRTKPLARKSSNRFASPSKSIVIDTPKRHGLSPWRIKVTVETEPKEGGSSRGSDRSTSVSVAKRSRVVSPAKRAGPESLEEEETRRTPRRRKNMHPVRSAMDPDSASDSEPSTRDSHVIPKPSISPLRQPPRRRSRMNAIPATSQRSKRLNAARDELDEALQSAIGSPISQAEGEVPGDITVSANEDFSMVSMDSLLSTKNTGLSHALSTIPEQNNSVASISYAPSSPPKIEYPDITGPAREARASLGRSDYDAMSWKPTGHVQVTIPLPPAQQDNSEISVYQREESENASTRNPIHARTTEIAQRPTPRSPSDDAGLDDDIWQEEASRSLEDAENTDVQLTDQGAEQDQPQRFDDLFADQPLKPPRPKIPRTWRRSSGHDFSYVDSPERVADRPRKPSGTSTDDSGVLTPPTSDEESLRRHPQDQHEQTVSEHSELTQPDAAGTQFCEEPNSVETERTKGTNSVPHEDDPTETISDSDSDSDSSVSSPDAEDTGLFWQSNLPNVYRSTRAQARPRRQATMDLSDILKSDAIDGKEAQASVSKSKAGTNSINGNHQASTGRTRRPEPPRLRAITDGFHLKPTPPEDGKILLSPLRKSLLKSSKISAGAANIGIGIEGARHLLTEDRSLSVETSQTQAEREYISGARHTGSTYLARRYPSKYTRHDAHVDQVKNPPQNSSHAMQDGAGSDPRSSTYGKTNGRTEDTEVSQSYEEQLNLDSPMKIRVNFNDSSGNSSSLLASGNRHSPIRTKPLGPAEEQPELERTKSPPFVTLVAPKAPASSQGLFSRLSTNFWSAVIRPSGPTEVLPYPRPVADAHDARADALFPAELRTRLRGRYGVVSEQFPWTMAHIRTLHRMLNSRETPRADTLIPDPSGPLPPNLAAMADTTQTSVTGHRFRFTRAHAHVVFAFAQILVPRHVILAMRTGEVEWLGDPLARRCRGFYGDRHGDEAVWKVETVRPDIVRWVDGLKGQIFLEFVVRALGDVVWSNEQLAAKQRIGL